MRCAGGRCALCVRLAVCECIYVCVTARSVCAPPGLGEIEKKTKNEEYNPPTRPDRSWTAAAPASNSHATLCFLFCSPLFDRQPRLDVQDDVSTRLLCPRGSQPASYCQGLCFMFGTTAKRGRGGGGRRGRRIRGRMSWCWI